MTAKTDFYKALQENKSREEIDFLYHVYLIDYSNKKIHSDQEINDYGRVESAYISWVNSLEDRVK